MSLAPFNRLANRDKLGVLVGTRSGAEASPPVTSCLLADLSKSHAGVNKLLELLVGRLDSKGLEFLEPLAAIRARKEA